MRRSTKWIRGSADLAFSAALLLFDTSIMVFRLKSADPGIKMPELPSLLPDQRGVELISAWIAAMPPDDCAAE